MISLQRYIFSHLTGRHHIPPESTSYRILREHVWKCRSTWTNLTSNESIYLQAFPPGLLTLWLGISLPVPPSQSPFNKHQRLPQEGISVQSPNTHKVHLVTRGAGVYLACSQINTATSHTKSQGQNQIANSEGKGVSECHCLSHPCPGTMLAKKYFTFSENQSPTCLWKARAQVSSR